jgi:ASC-1-like (ASCH) protein
MHLVKNVSEPWFTQIAARKKIVEGRLYKSDFVNLKPGDTVTWVNEDFGFKRSIKTQVMRTTRYDTFRRYLIAEKLANTLPSHGVTTVDKGVKIYRRFFDEKAEKENGVLAIKIKVITRQASV